MLVMWARPEDIPRLHGDLTRALEYQVAGEGPALPSPRRQPEQLTGETKACFDNAMQTEEEMHFEMPNLKASGTYLN